MGAGIVVVAQTGRLADLSGGLCDPSDPEAVMGRIIPFVVQGLHGIVNRQKPSPESPAG